MNKYNDGDWAKRSCEKHGLFYWNQSNFGVKKKRRFDFGGISKGNSKGRKMGKKSKNALYTTDIGHQVRLDSRT